MPIKRPKSTATPGNPIDAVCDDCGEICGQGETEEEAIENAENAGADVTLDHTTLDWRVECFECWKRN